MIYLNNKQSGWWGFAHMLDFFYRVKLKLETQQNATILVVSETMELAHLAVLKAGLSKLFQSGKKAVLLDFTSVTLKDSSLPQQIFELRGFAHLSGAQVVVISPDPKIGHATNLQKGL